MQAHIFIIGFVQGVGFRQFIKKKALGANLKGTVRNLPDGRVEVIAQGSKDNVQKLIKICEKGPFFSDVKSVQIEWETEEDFEDFKVLH